MKVKINTEKYIIIVWINTVKRRKKSLKSKCLENEKKKKNCENRHS